MVKFPQGLFSWPVNCFGTPKWPLFLHGQKLTGRTVTMETILAHNFSLLSVEKSTLGTIVTFKTMGISICWNCRDLRYLL